MSVAGGSGFHPGAECHIGIDLGTTYSCVGVWKPVTTPGEHAAVEVLVNDINKRTTPSVVSFEGDRLLVGEEAKRKHGQNTIHAVKRIMGKTFDDPTVAQHRKQYQYEIVNQNGKAACRVDFQGRSQVYSPEYISSLVVTRMREIAEKARGTKITSAVITVPAYFTDTQRAATRKAGEMAGLFVSQIINEPTAAAIAYGVQQRKTGDLRMQKVLVYDFGGGTFDITILDMDGQDFKSICHGGDAQLGGEDLDMRVVDHVLDQFISTNGGSRRHFSAKSMNRLRKECETAKMLLSGRSTLEVEIQVDNFHNGEDLFCELTRAEFEYACEEIFQKTISILGETLRDANLSQNQIEEVLLVGGSSQIPRVRELVRQFFAGRTVRGNINHAEAIAVGATIHAATRAQERIAEVPNSSASVPMRGNNLVPTVRLQDVTAHSLGVDYGENDELMSKIILKGSKLPASGTNPFSNMYFTDKLLFTIYQGEGELVAQNAKIDTFWVKSDRVMSPGEFKVVVHLELSSENILSVTAKSTAGAHNDVQYQIRRETWT